MAIKTKNNITSCHQRELGQWVLHSAWVLWVVGCHGDGPKQINDSLAFGILYLFFGKICVGLNMIAISKKHFILHCILLKLM